MDQVEVRIFRFFSIAAGTFVRIWLSVMDSGHQVGVGVLTSRPKSGINDLISARIAFDFFDFFDFVDFFDSGYKKGMVWKGFVSQPLPFELHSSVGWKHAKLLASSISICAYLYMIWVSYTD